MGSSLKKILVMPIKNEEWILETSLASSSLWADYIIVADQHSTDRTEEICKKFEKVIYVKNNHPGLNQSVARQLLLDEARKIPGNNLLFVLDADEILSANALHDTHFWKTLDTLKEGQSVVLQWITLRGSIKTYRNDGSIRSNSWKHFIFRDDRKANYNLHLATSEPRMPEHYMKDSIRIESVVNLHFQFVDMGRMFAKQRRYRIYDFLNAGKKNFLTCLKINSIYYPTKMNQGLVLAHTAHQWLDGYETILKTIAAGAKDGVYWYDKESLEKIQKYGVSYFRYLDIRDVDWKKNAHVLGMTSVFKDPRNILVKLYHKSQFILSKMIACIPQGLKKYL